jgi:NADH-quinone oxidoreductase subunit J
MLTGAAAIAFYALALLALATGLAVVVSTNLIHSALFLVACFALVAGLYFELGADFLAAVQIIIYVGAIMVLMIFAIMLTRDANSPASNATNRQRLPALIVAASLAVVMGLVALTTVWPVNSVAPAEDTVAILGRLLFNQYALPFEIASLVLLVAVVGAIVVAREDDA